MAYAGGFTYIKGPYQLVLSTISSNATFRAGNPVSVSSVGRTLIETKSTHSLIFGIAQNNAADSLPGAAWTGKALILVPTAETVFAAKIQTGVATSVTSIGQVFGIEKSGNYMRPDTDSATTPFVVIVPRDDYSTVDSGDSSVFVSFLASRLAPFSSIFSQPEF